MNEMCTITVNKTYIMNSTQQSQVGPPSRPPSIHSQYILSVGRYVDVDRQHRDGIWIQLLKKTVVNSINWLQFAISRVGVKKKIVLTRALTFSFHTVDRHPSLHYEFVELSSDKHREKEKQPVSRYYLKFRIYLPKVSLPTSHTEHWTRHSVCGS